MAIEYSGTTILPNNFSIDQNKSSVTCKDVNNCMEHLASGQMK